MLVGTDSRITETGAEPHCRRVRASIEQARLKCDRVGPSDKHMFVSCQGKLSQYLAELGLSAAASFAICMIAVLPSGSRRGTPIAPVYRLPMPAPSCRYAQT